MTKVMFNFQIHRGIIKSEIKMFWNGFVKAALYFSESAAALNELKYFCLNHVYNAAW